MSRAASRAQTQTRLLDAAEALFAEKGFHAASLDEIAERAGYTRGALYWNFAGKDELFHAVIERRSQERLEKIAQLRRENPTAEGFVASLAQLDEDDGEAARRWHLLALEQMAYALRQPAERKRIAVRERRVHQEIGEQARAVYAQLGVAPPFDAAEMGVVIHALDWGLRTQRRLNPAAAPTRLLTETLALLLQASAGATAPRPRPRLRSSKQSAG